MKRGGFLRKVGKTNSRTAFEKIKPKTVSYWKKEAWKVFSRWIRERDNWTCYTCGKHYPPTKGHGATLHAGHFISRSHNNTLFSEVNVHAQCYYCNVRERGNIGEYAYRLKKELGDKGFEKLLEDGRKLKTFTIPELQSIIQRYETNDVKNI